VQSIFERSHDAEVATAAAQAPQKLGIFLRAGVNELAARGDDVRRLKVVARETEAAAEPAEPSAERQAGRAGVGNSAGRRGEIKRRAFTIQLTEQCARLEIRGTSSRIAARPRPRAPWCAENPVAS
jgi:hypothetical protein